MKQLPGLDASFLHLETSSQFGHVSGLSVFERPHPDFRPLEAWQAQLGERLHLLAPLRRRLVEVPFGLDHPFWIEDPDFDLDYHVRHTAVPRPGTMRQLEDLVARLVSRPLDRRHPLWETYVIDGLEDDRFAVLTKIHHAAVDGAAGVELLTIMLDADPAGTPVPPPAHPWRPERVPTEPEILARAAASLARKPGRAVLLTARTVRDFGRATRNPVVAAAGSQLRRSLRGPVGRVLNVGRPRDEDMEVQGPLPGRAPRTPFNRSITPHRRLAIRTASLGTVKEIKGALGATVNDVVMAVCAGALRTYLQKQGALPDEPLIAMVPVSIRTGQEEDPWTNRVSSIFATLPTHIDDPLGRVAAVNQAMGNAKELFNAVPAEQLTNFAEFASPAVFTRAMRVATRIRLGDRLAQPSNLVVSNVPGPRQPLYAAGARLLHYYPVSTIVDGQGLNITVQSYLDNLDFGLVACRELVPDLDLLGDLMLDELEILRDAAGLGARTEEAPAPEPPPPAPRRTRTMAPAARRRAPAER